MAVGATDVRVLGPFELVHDGQVMPVGGPVGQAIVTVLACRPDTKVLPAELITMVWGDPDAASSETLYSHVTRLRRVLAPAGLAIVGHRPGYRLPVAAEQVDLARFDELLRTARALSDTDPDEAGQRLRAAVGLWRGPSALDNVTLPGIRRLAAAWEARRLDAEEELAEIDLCRGRPDHVLDRLHTLAATHPSRPRLAAALARALAATGRTDQAYTVLTQAERAARRAGDPVHPALVQARRALAPPGSDAGFGPSAGAGWDSSSPSAQPDPVASRVVPFQLPADTVRFTGRADYLARLLDLRPDPDRSRRLGRVGWPGDRCGDRGGGHGWDRQDRAGGARRAPAGRPVLRRGVVHRPARVHPTGGAHRTGARPGPPAARAGGARAADPAGPGRAGGLVSQCAGPPPGAGRAGQRGRRSPDRTAAAGHPQLPGDRDLPPAPGRLGRRDPPDLACVGSGRGRRPVSRPGRRPRDLGRSGYGRADRGPLRAAAAGGPDRCCPAAPGPDRQPCHHLR